MKKYLGIITLLFPVLSLFSESQGELRAKKNLQISVNKPSVTGLGIRLEYFLGEKLSVGVGYDRIHASKTETSLSLPLADGSSVSHKEATERNLHNAFLTATLFPFSSNGIYISGRFGTLDGFGKKVSDNIGVTPQGDLRRVTASSPPYGYKIEESPAYYLGGAFGYRHIFDSGLFIGLELSVSHRLGQIHKKYIPIPDASSLAFVGALPPSVLDLQYAKDSALRTYDIQRNLAYFNISVGTSF
ncbi:hypothetical protein CH373_17905 [Leptospira perolatii]|uniref:Outer membrane protein beta-barrel domain-containing protein n=1 Tax=Leptospira perolatii TaxID=2023191 RepID=A0A2M9ZIF2_9LEPT|nr:hypothetical protein [Leptospira perolatii]PJZ68123.1 hypothetical protein CH360_17850 [Leptospira perolatii]PJZ71744.1 hypothetical protein CH373_17905 [Leptospira perolatii]